MTKNLIVSMATGYGVDKIKNFVLSLRQYYQDDVLVISDNQSNEFREFLESHNIYSYILGESVVHHQVGYLRWSIPKEIITEHFTEAEHVILSDIRDVVFQANPFDHMVGGKYEFSCEPKLIGECPVHNAAWIRNIYGEQGLEQVRDQWILCAGVTAGTREGVLDICAAIMHELETLPNGIDQAALNMLYGRGRFPEAVLHLTGDSLIATMHHAETLTFDRAGYLLGNKGQRIAMVHQYDRVGFSSLNFIRTAQQIRGTVGVQQAAEYAARNIPDHDL